MRAVRRSVNTRVGDRRRHVAKLQQPVEPQVAHAIEVALVEARAR